MTIGEVQESSKDVTSARELAVVIADTKDRAVTSLIAATILHCSYFTRHEFGRPAKVKDMLDFLDHTSENTTRQFIAMRDYEHHKGASCAVVSAFAEIMIVMVSDNRTRIVQSALSCLKPLVPWIEHHRTSEAAASHAEMCMRDARYHYARAAEAEEQALAALDDTRARTYGITAVSAAALNVKARQSDRAKRIIDEALACSWLPDYSANDLRKMMPVVQNTNVSNDRDD